MEEQGPASPELVEALAGDQDKHDHLIFFTYLYYNTYWGLKAVSRRTILVPTAHDEPALRLRLMAEVFGRPAAFLFNTAAEQDMLAARFSFAGKYQDIVGVGVDLPEPPEYAAAVPRHKAQAPYVLYAGRIEPGKGCAEMLGHFLAEAGRFPRLKLLLIGKLLMPLPDDPRVRYLGFVSPEEKNAAMSQAVATIHPSHYESLCMAALESMAVRTPVLVQQGSEPLRRHAVLGRTGLTFSNREEFGAALELLSRDRRLRAGLGENGRAYVRENYSWTRILEKYDILFRGLT
jgi:glycosyltransferase involved in cell wall biosynthesis